MIHEIQNPVKAGFWFGYYVSDTDIIPEPKYTKKEGRNERTKKSYLF